MILWIAYILIEAIIQGYLIEQRSWKPNYFQLFIFRGWASIAHGIFFLNVQADPWYQYPLLLAYQCGTFWVIFDLTLNTLRNKPWHYKGNNSGWLDKLPVKIYWPLKGIALIAALVCGYLYQINFN